MKDKKFSERLKELREKHGLSQDKARLLYDLGLRMYQRYENGEVEPETITLRHYEILLEKYENENDLTKYLTREALKKEHKGIAFYDTDVSAGAVEMFDDTREEPRFWNTVPGLEDCDGGVRVFGHSMYPTYPQGIYIILKRVNDFDIIPYGECFLVITDEFKMLKRLLKSKYKGYVVAASDNDQTTKDGVKIFESFEVPKNKIRKLFLVKGEYRKNQI